MKTRILFAALLLSLLLTAGFAINPQPEPPGTLSRLNPTDRISDGFDLTKMPVLKNKFIITPVNALKTSLGSRQPVKVMTATAPSPLARQYHKMATPIDQLPAVPLNPYATDKGVVLDVFNTTDKATSSTLVAHGVIWYPTFINNYAAKNPQTSLSLSLPQTGNTLFAEGYFFNLATGPHTYLLTLGTSLAPAYVGLKINNQNIAPNQLIASPSTNEIRVLFSYDSYSPSSSCIGVSARLITPPSPALSHLSLHHIQLAQID